MDNIKNVLLDIEGTICPISFVKETLFPYALKALPHVLRTQWDDKEFQPYRDAFPEEARASPEALQAHVEDLTKRDVKVASLKNLQGYLWNDGYKTGEYSTPLFEDVAPALKQWSVNGIQLAIYSSGSVFAQKLLFEHVNVAESKGSTTTLKRGPDPEEADDAVEPPKKRGRTTRSQTTKAAEVTTKAEANGTSDEESTHTQTEDLSGLIGGWFDTTNAGLKMEASSYTKIVETLSWQPSETLFLSDNIKEVDAAIEAGLESILIDRPGNAPVSETDRARVTLMSTFEGIKLQPSTESVEVPQENAEEQTAAKAETANGVVAKGAEA